MTIWERTAALPVEPMKERGLAETTSVRFGDTELSNGQRAFAAFCVDVALDIALALDTIKVEHIEAGTLAAGAHSHQRMPVSPQLIQKTAASARCGCKDVAARGGQQTDLYVATPLPDGDIGQPLDNDRTQMRSRSVAAVVYALDQGATLNLRPSVTREKTSVAIIANRHRSRRPTCPSKPWSFSA
jgi:hypothetical protein